MTDNDPDRNLREKLLRYAKEAGAQSADVIAVRAQNFDVSVRKSVIQDANRAESFGVGLRIFKGNRHAYGSTADPSDEGLQRLAKHVSDMTDVVPEDPHSRLAYPHELVKNPPDLDLCDPHDPSDVKQLSAIARRAEETALGVNGITNSDGAHAGQGMHWIGLSTSNGFSNGYVHSSYYVSISVIAGTGEQMETDHASHQATYARDLEDPALVGKRAAHRTLARLGARNGKTGQYPVIFDRRIAASILRSLTRAASGVRIAKGTSFLNDYLERQICSPAITVIDDPFKKRGIRSSPFDAEGLPGQKRLIVENGILKTFFLDLRSALRLNMSPTGHANRGLSSPPSPAPSNAWIEAGSKSREEMIRDIGEGFLVTELMGASISLATGDYSRGASGLWIEGGQIAYPVAEMTIAGNLKDMFMRMTPASDLEFRDGIDAPSLLIEGMTVASR